MRVCIVSMGWVAVLMLLIAWQWVPLARGDDPLVSALHSIHRSWHTHTHTQLWHLIVCVCVFVRACVCLCVHVCVLYCLRRFLFAVPHDFLPQRNPTNNIHYLYLVDSIVKNVRGKYIQSFQDKLPQLVKYVMGQVRSCLHPMLTATDRHTHPPTHSHTHTHRHRQTHAHTSYGWRYSPT